MSLVQAHEDLPGPLKLFCIDESSRLGGMVAPEL